MGMEWYFIMEDICVNYIKHRSAFFFVPGFGDVCCKSEPATDFLALSEVLVLAGFFIALAAPPWLYPRLYQQKALDSHGEDAREPKR